MSRSGHPSKCNGGDFILESTNRLMKMWMPPDVPTPKRWMRVCRNPHNIDKMKVRLVNDDAEDLVDTGFRFVICSFIFFYNISIIIFLFLS